MVRSRQRVVLDAVAPRQTAGFVVFPPRSGGPAYEGLGDTEYACPCCGTVVCQGAKHGLFAGMVFRCGACGRLSRVPDARGRLPVFE